MNRTRFTFIFFVKRGKLLKNGEAPICLRITVNGIAVESQIKRSVPPEAWDQNTQSVKGRDRRAQETNECIRMLKIRTLQIHRDLELSGAHFTARLIMNKVFSAEEKRTLLSIFRRHNDDIRKLIGIELEKRTVTRYDSCCRYMEDMIKAVYGKDDVTLAEVNGEFVRHYEMHLKVVRGCQANTVIRYMKCFKKVIHMALANEWMTKRSVRRYSFLREAGQQGCANQRRTRYFD